MRNKTLTTLKKLFGTLLTAAIITTSAAAPASTAFANTAGTNRKAITAYKKMLAKKTFSWSSNLAQAENDTSSYTFLCKDLNGDGVSELVVTNPNACYAAGYTKVFAYVNHNVKCVTTCSGITWYQKGKIIGIEDAHTGAYWGDFYRLTKNGKLIVKASYGGTDDKSYAKKAKHTEHSSYGFSIYYTNYKINNKETSYKNYKKQFKKMTKNQKAATLHFQKNTKANRAKMK